MTSFLCAKVRESARRLTTFPREIKSKTFLANEMPFYISHKLMRQSLLHLFCSTEMSPTTVTFQESDTGIFHIEP